MRKLNDTKRKVDVENIRKAVEEYSFDTSCYPQTLPACGKSLIFENKVYLKKVPCDPKGDPYGFETSNLNCNTWFKVLARIEVANDKSIERVGCGSGCGRNCDYNYGLSSPNVAPYDGCIPEPTPVPPSSTSAPTPTITPTPSPTPRIYACAPPASVRCIEYIDPELSQCPKVYPNDPTCNNECGIKANRCHDERGKRN